MILAYKILIILFLIYPKAQANEVVRPEKYQDFSHINYVTLEGSVQVNGSVVAWADYEAIRRDFPTIKNYTNAQIDQWLIRNFSYIGQSQHQLNEIRNSTIPKGTKTKIAIRPAGWNRSAILEASEPDGKSIGMVDIKGFGHGAQSEDEVRMQLERVKHVGLDSEKINDLRVKDHSDGLMSLGEAIAETSRQKAAQKLFEMSGKNLETVESYAIISLPFDILKDKNQKVPAALYLRQAHQGRQNGIEVPPSIYIDERGGRQMTDSGTAVDFGAVVITDERLNSHFGSNDPVDLNPQKSKPWIWGHETAQAWKNGDKQAIHRHLNDMLMPLEEAYKASPNVSARALKIKEKLNFFNSHKNKPFAERAKLFETWRVSVDGVKPDVPLESIKEGIKSPIGNVWLKAYQNLKDHKNEKAVTLIEELLRHGDVIARYHATLALSGRTDPKSLVLLEKSLNDPESSVRVASLEALYGRSESRVIELFAKAMNDAESKVRLEAATAMAGRNDPKSLELLEKALKDTEMTTQRYGIKVLGTRTDPKSLELLQKMLVEGSDFIQYESAQALMTRKEPMSTKTFFLIYHHPHKSIRQEFTAIAKYKLLAHSEISQTCLKKIIFNLALNL